MSGLDLGESQHLVDKGDGATCVAIPVFEVGELVKADHEKPGSPGSVGQAWLTEVAVEAGIVVVVVAGASVVDGTVVAVVSLATVLARVPQPDSTSAAATASGTTRPAAIHDRRRPVSPVRD